jgi:hypothetical protein
MSRFDGVIDNKFAVRARAVPDLVIALALATETATLFSQKLF